MLERRGYWAEGAKGEKIGTTVSIINKIYFKKRTIVTNKKLTKFLRVLRPAFINEKLL